LNVRTALLGLFVALTIVLASTTVYESGIRTTLTSTSTLTGTTTTATTTSTSTITKTSSILMANGFQFITGSGICTANGALALCWGEPAFVFNCGPSLLTRPNESCSQVVPNHGPLPYPPFGLSITSYSNQSEPWANCAYKLGFASEVGAYCVLLNSTAFILGEPAPPTSPSGVQSSEVASIQVPAASVSRLNPETGLDLTLNLTANAGPYPAISVTAYDVNTLDRANNLTTPGDWAVPLSKVSGACGSALIEYVLYQGDYGLENFTQGTPLSQTFGFGICTTLATSYCIFNPLSTEETIYWAPGPLTSNPSPGKDTLSVSLLGFWGTNPSYPQGAYLVFPAGTYTVAAMDEWGNIVLSHFTVQG
jgi:hypothetical protein